MNRDSAINKYNKEEVPIPEHVAEEGGMPLNQLAHQH